MSVPGILYQAAEPCVVDSSAAPKKEEVKRKAPKMMEIA
jgi:hypothetical protein